MTFRLSNGRPYPLGATVTEDGINFAIFSRHGRQVYLELFDDADATRAAGSFALHPRTNRTGDVWHIFVHGAAADQLYGWRVDGPYAPAENGHRFNVHKLLFDPYARALVGDYTGKQDAVFGYDRGSTKKDLSFNAEDSTPFVYKSVALPDGNFDWQDEPRPHIPLEQTIIYEVHLRGLTVHPSSAVRHPGTYRGVIEKIPYLKNLGVTTVEFLPVHEFSSTDGDGEDPETGAALHNYWGYSTLGFFAPKMSYASTEMGTSKDGNFSRAVREFKEMVRTLHQARIEVILDVVFNHTAEGDERGPTLFFRGLDNAVYYMLEGNRRYKNFSGCGNTVNCNHPVVKKLILDCLRYWVVEMHVDGFRFDLATILGRGRDGEWLGDLSLLYDICGDPVLRGSKLIAESWDSHGLYKVGGFPEGWGEWNGRFRDDIRRFVRGDQGLVPSIARHLGGSADLFAAKGTPVHSINFITCHDGFTLRDLVSYKEKHNERNGEDNRDGASENFSCNYGVEGETNNEVIEELRKRQAKNMLALMMLSRGTPMLLGGDELWRTQSGNNNTYCQDNELGWLIYPSTSEAEEMQRFVVLLLAMRKQHPALRRELFVDPFPEENLEPETNNQLEPDITWHGILQQRPDWSHHSHSLALHIHGRAPAAALGTDDDDLFVMINAWTKPLPFALPILPTGKHWHRLIDTALPSPQDILPHEEMQYFRGNSYTVKDHSVVVLVTK